MIGNNETQNIRLFIDTETTGLNPKYHSVIQIAAILDIDEYIIDTFNVKVRPVNGGGISQESLEFLNIKESDFLNPEYLDDDVAYQQLLDFMLKHYLDKDQFTIIGHNIRFDIDVLNTLFLRNQDDLHTFPFAIFDTLQYARENMPECDKYNLGFLCEHFGLKLENAHDAMADITANRELFYKMNCG